MTPFSREDLAAMVQAAADSIPGAAPEMRAGMLWVNLVAPLLAHYEAPDPLQALIGATVSVLVKVTERARTPARGVLVAATPAAIVLRATAGTYAGREVILARDACICIQAIDQKERR